MSEEVEIDQVLPLEEPVQEAAPVEEVKDEKKEEHVDESTLEEARLVASGTILEAAFVDPAYSWPPQDGEGKNAIELQASIQLLEDEDNFSTGTTESMKRRMKMPKEPEKTRWWNCCRSKKAVSEVTEYEVQKAMALEARKEHSKIKKDTLKQKEKDFWQRNKYNRVPEGILIYRLNTATHMIELVSPPHSKTDMSKLVTKMKVVRALPSPDKSRRGMEVVGEDGKIATLVACEQRTATAWLEAMHLMHAKADSTGAPNTFFSKKSASYWSKEQLESKDLSAIESGYLNLANYSNKLIRAGALPGGKKGSGGAGGIYYSIDRVKGDAEVDDDEEALEAIAKRRAVIKDSWDFYRMICSLLRDRSKYDEVFRKLQLDPVYPYLNSMTGLNDPGEAQYENLDKPIMQKDLAEYEGKTPMQVAKMLAAQAESALPSLVEICKALAGSLGMEEVGVGPIKDPEAALRKAEKKYGGDLLKVTDFCRALLVVKDIPTLLALLELARDSFGPLIRRVKMCTLKADYAGKPGGYRDCIINVELKDHICEIQVHLWPMWIVCGIDGFRHYRHCVEYSTDTFEDPFDALEGLDRKTMAELIVMAEEAVADTPLDNLEWYHEKFILDYFAEAGLFMKHGLDVWAEITFRHLIRLRTESPDIGPDHHLTVVLYKYLAQCLRAQNKTSEANQVMERVTAAEAAKSKEKKDAEKSLWESFLNAPTDAFDMILDPTRKAREEEEKLRKEVKASKKQWRRIRQERFAFLDSDAPTQNSNNVNERKVEDMSVH